MVNDFQGCKQGLAIDQCREGAVGGSGCCQAPHGLVNAWWRKALCYTGCDDTGNDAIAIRKM